VPKAFPVAPEDEEFPEEIRQMIVGRYRILFTIKGRKVHVLHVRGAFTGQVGQLERKSNSLDPDTLRRKILSATESCVDTKPAEAMLDDR
jgi:hypothetical protein